LSSTAQKPTGTDALIEVMEKWGESEPKALLVVWTDEDGNISVHTLGACTQAIGLAAYAKKYLLRWLLK
jgi:hypothetical protein